PNQLAVSGSPAYLKTTIQVHFSERRLTLHIIFKLSSCSDHQLFWQTDHGQTWVVL
ncbi:hypothetical protein KI387_001355, partial [Taxus chinensis]